MRAIIRRVTAGLLMACLLFGLAACQGNDPAPDETATPSPTASAALSPDSSTVPELPPSDMPEEAPVLDEATTELINGMQPVFDSIIRALMPLPEEARYLDSSDDTLFWTVMYYFCANYGTLHPDAFETDNQCVIPGHAMQEYADACFAEYDGIPDIPPQTFDIVYDRDQDMYYVGLSDAGDTYTAKISYAVNTYGEIEAVMGFFTPSADETDDLLAVFRFTLVDNGMAEGEEPIFPYRVQSANEYYTDLAQVTRISEKNGIYYATLDFVAEVFHSASDLDENGQPYGSDFREMVNAKKEAVDVRISERATFNLQNFNSVFEDADMEKASANSYQFFVDNAALETPDGEHLYFALNIYDGVLHGGQLSDYYYAG